MTNLKRLAKHKHSSLFSLDVNVNEKMLNKIADQNINIGFNVSTLTTAGTIANTGPPPTCTMRIANSNGDDISQAEIGDELMLQVIFHPTLIFVGTDSTSSFK
jgi:hypothetical protein